MSWSKEVTIKCDGVLEDGYACGRWERFSTNKVEEAERRLEERRPSWTKASSGEHYCSGCSS